VNPVSYQHHWHQSSLASPSFSAITRHVVYLILSVYLLYRILLILFQEHLLKPAQIKAFRDWL